MIPLPAGVIGAAANMPRDAQGRVIWTEGSGAIPVMDLEEISVTATRDYLPAVIAGMILLYALTRRGKA